MHVYQPQSLKQIMPQWESYLSISVINEYLGFLSLTDKEEQVGELVDSVSIENLSEFLIEGTKRNWANLDTTNLSPCYGALKIITVHSWIPSTYKTHVSWI